MTTPESQNQLAKAIQANQELQEALRVGQVALDRLKEELKGWLPITTAPRNGDRVLCMSADWGCPVFLRFYQDHPRRHEPVWEDEYELDCSFDIEDNPPTHWLPIPPFKP